MKPLLPLALLLCLSACNPKPTGTADVMTLDIPALMNQQGEIKLSDFIESIDFVVIQPHNDWFFPRHTVTTKVLNNYLMFSEYHGAEGSIGIFRRNGEFLLRLARKGKGPGEYNAVSEMGMDPAETKIWVLEGYRATLHWYDLQGNWLESIKLPTDVSHVRVLGSGEIIAQNTRWEPDFYDSCRLFLADREGKFIRSLWDKSKSIPDYSNFLDNNWLFETNNELYYRDNPNSDTVYQLNREYHLEPFLVMDPGKLRIPPEILDDFNRMQEWNNYLRMHQVFIMKDLILLEGGMKRSKQFLIDRKTGQTVCSEMLDDDMLGLKTWFEDRSVQSDYLFRTIYIPVFKGHLDAIFNNDNPKLKSLQEKLRKTMAEASDEIEMIVVLYKVK
jgi:hypothetical protein